MGKDDNELTAELLALLLANGADLAAVGDMAGATGGLWQRGVSVAAALPKKVIVDLKTAPTREYHELYHSLNAKLNRIVQIGEQFLKARGFTAHAQTTDRVKPNAERISPLPHKTVATRAGLGWIGKNCLLVTRQFGPAVRLSSLLANAPLACSEPVNNSSCGECSACVRHCPCQALSGRTWQAGTARASLLEHEKCYATQLELMQRHTGIKTDLCGKCFAVCAYAQKYLAVN